MALTLGIDLGTSGVRAVAVDEAGSIVAESTRSYPLLTPHPGWTEQRPEDWLAGATDALKDLAAQLEGREIAALGLSGQMHGMVPLDAQGEVIRPALLWNDQRTGEGVAEIEAAVPREMLIARTGNPAITGFQLPKLLWLRQAEPENFARLTHVLLPKDYLGFALTGVMAAEPSDASGTNCFEVNRKVWDAEVLGALGLSTALFPDIVASHEVTRVADARHGDADRIARRVAGRRRGRGQRGGGDRVGALTPYPRSGQRFAGYLRRHLRSPGRADARPGGTRPPLLPR